MRGICAICRGTRKPASVGSSSFVAGSSDEGARRLEFIRREAGSGRHPSSRSGYGGARRLCSILRRDLNERLFAEQPKPHPALDGRLSALLKADFMQNLSPRHVKTEES